MADKVEVKTSKKHTLFNPAFIDDYGFTPEEFRVFSRIMRRSLGNEKGCFESVPEMAKSLGMSERLVKRAFKVLTACGAVARTERPGKTDLFDFNTCEKWKPSKDLSAIRSKIDAETKRADRERKTVRVGAETHGVSGCGNASTTGCGNAPSVGAETPYEGIEAKASLSHKEITGREEAQNAPAPEQAESENESRHKQQFRSLSASEVLKRPAYVAPVETEAETIYREVFGAAVLRGDQIKLFENIPDFRADVWRRTCELWRKDGYRASSLGSLIDRYSKEVAKQPKIANGFIQHNTKPISKFTH